MNKRVLIALPNDSLGGAEQYLKLVAQELLSYGYKVDVFFLKKKVSCAWEDLKSCNVTLNYTESVTEKSGVLSMVNSISRNRHVFYDYVFTSHIHTNSLLGLLRKIRILNCKYLIGRESTSAFLRFTGLKLFVFKCMYLTGYFNLDLLICQSSLMKHQLVNALPSLASKILIEVLPNPVNLDFIKKKAEHCFGLDEVMQERCIVSAGRLIDEKGFDVLISAFKLVKIVEPNLKLVILGEGANRASLSNQIEKLNLTTDVCLLGFTENVYPYFKTAILCVVSSRIEGFPNVLLQMMSQNTKVVSTKCAGGIEDIPGIFLAEPNDVVSLSSAIQVALATDTRDNKKAFDIELCDRSIKRFLTKINEIVEAELISS